MLYPIILSGGFGGRLWPVSRTSKPKQFIPLINDNTLLQDTVLRLQGIEAISAPTLVCNSEHRFMAAEQLRQIGVNPRCILLEPAGRNTAPAIAVAAFSVLTEDPDALLLVTPSDHTILDIPSFHKTVRDGMSLAEEGYLVTFGIMPTSPKTGYGYIHKGVSLNGSGKAFQIDCFVEKPNREVAKQYLKSRNYLWNSGIFLFKASLYLDELKKFAPSIYEACKQAYDSKQTDTDFSWLDAEAFGKCPSDSIDCAIMEKTEHAAVLPVNMGWSDVGSWGSLWEVVQKDAHGNAADGHVFMKDVRNCYIKSDKEIVATLGLKDLIIIDTEDALLVAHIDKEQEVRDVFKKLM